MTSEAPSYSFLGCVLGGRYRVIELIGRGGSASVYRAERDGESVALKIIHPRLARMRLPAARFHREARAVSRIDHPGCVRVLDWGVDAEWQYIAMELVDGEDLDHVLLREGPLPETRALSIALAVCDVLCAAHALGVVHRDLKPRNIKLLPETGRDVRVKVLDFGLAKLLQQGRLADETVPNALTRPESTLGTPSYMAPEQVRQRTVDGRADIYALGVVLYEMITGRRPTEGDDPVTVILRLTTEMPLPPSVHRSDVHPPLEELIMRCLAKDPARRPESAAALREELAAMREDLEDRADAEPTQVMTDDDATVLNELTAEPDEPTELQPTRLYRGKRPRLHGALHLPRLYTRDDEVTDSKTTKLWKPLAGGTLDALTTEAVTAARHATAARPVTEARLEARAVTEKRIAIEARPAPTRTHERPWLMLLLLFLALSFLVWVLTSA